ncbi:hypothetical protein ASG73_00675 [Janibacter sp. Soil728]|nr:hypothetical protein ASG73_00675 [Janibacter sp. Soil728]
MTLVDLDDRVVSPEIRDAPIIDGPAPAGFEPAAIPMIHGEPDDDPTRMSFVVLHLAVLDDGRRVTLLDDRGWGAAGSPDLWERTTVDEIADDARTVVGPDEAYGDHSQYDMADEHWARLATTLREHDVIISGTDLGLLPHDVELSQRLRARLGRS